MKHLGQAAPITSEKYIEPPRLTLMDKTTDPKSVLTNLVELVIREERSYEDYAEQIEDKAFELCESGEITGAVEKLTAITCFFESLHDKNDEQCRDLADVYLLLGQIHQFAGLYNDSIPWFSKAAIVDDRYAAPFHSMAVSYVQLEQSENAIRCFEQELVLSPGNYYTYLLLADIYQKENRGMQVEDCLKRLLERNPENIQGLHSLIKHYERSDQTIDTSLLVRRLMGINRQLSRVEVVIKAYYFCREKRYTEVLDFIDSWTGGSGEAVTITDLIKAHTYREMRQYKKSTQILQKFRIRNHGRYDIMLVKLQEFEVMFGSCAGNALRRRLFLSSTKI